MELLRPLFPVLFEKIRHAGWAREFPAAVSSGADRGMYYTLMLDGSDYFHSTCLQCPSCLQRRDSSGQVQFRHTVVFGTLVKAGSHRVLPLDVEEVRNEDGQDKQGCEINAGKRLIPHYVPIMRIAAALEAANGAGNWTFRFCIRKYENPDTPCMA